MYQPRVEREARRGSLALVFGRNLKVEKIFQVTGTKKKRARNLGKEVSVVYGKSVGSLVEAVRYRDFIATNNLSNPKLDSSNNFRRGMLVAHVY